MFRFDEGLRAYLHREPLDFRVGINGLSILVEQAMFLMDPERMLRDLLHSE